MSAIIKFKLLRSVQQLTNCLTIFNFYRSLGYTHNWNDTYKHIKKPTSIIIIFLSSLTKIGIKIIDLRNQFIQGSLCVHYTVFQKMDFSKRFYLLN